MRRTRQFAESAYVSFPPFEMYETGKEGSENSEGSERDESERASQDDARPCGTYDAKCEKKEGGCACPWKEKVEKMLGVSPKKGE